MANYLITGATKGLGYDLLKNLKNESGNSIFVVCRSLESLTEIRELVDDFFVLDYTALEAFSPIDFSDWLLKLPALNNVVHCAGGGLGLREPDLNYAEFKKIFDVNILGAATLNAVLFKYFEKRGGGTLIHIGSTAATHAIGSVGYNSAKAALAAYVRSTGNYYVRKNILVCGINTGAFVAHENSMIRLKRRNIKIFNKFVSERLPRGEMMSAAEVISMIKYIVSLQSLSLAGSMIALDSGESLAY